MTELEVGPPVHGGHCVARVDGQVVFVRHALPGERVRVRFTEERKDFRRADAVEILDASPDRVEPPCPYARPGACGGCDLQHASLPAQRRLKAAVVKASLGESALAGEIDRLLGKPWDDELETFRHAGDGAPVRWLHQVV